MRCPFCSNQDSQVKDSRPTEDNTAIRRRRICDQCGSRFTTFERIQLRDLVIIKNNDKKEAFDRDKIVEHLSDKNHNFLFVLHNSLANANIMFKAFPDLKIIHLIRHPIDLIYSWMMKDYGKIGLNSNADLFKKIGVHPSIAGMNGPLPWYIYSIQKAQSLQTAILEFAGKNFSVPVRKPR